MKKILNILFLMVMTVSLFSQTTLTFEGKDRTGQDYVQLSRVSVFDLDQLWHQEIYYPDTTLVLYVNGTVGVETMCTSSLQMQNNPNPFDGTTDVVLSTPYDGDVTMEITDVNGRAVVETTHALSLPTGTHQFRLTLSAPGTYVLTARQNGRTVSVKMVNAGNGGNNGIEYMGVVETTHALSLQPKSNTRGDGHYPFHNGDLMRYTGYAVVDDVEIESETIQNTQNGSQTIPLKFDVARPTVVTNAASNIAASAATLNGEVTDDNNANVTERGFCYGTGNNPSLNGTHVAVNSGTGTFSAPVNSLTPATNYNVRAYATNMVGTSYGLQKTFRTMDTLPVVTTTEPSNITATTFTSGGDVLVLNSNSLTARGICWNTTGTPTIADSHTTQSGGLGSFTSNITGLECGTTYYVRAYATNSVGTSYGEEYSVTTTQELVRVVTGNVSNITDNSAVCGGEVPYDGCSEVTARGVCWSTEQNPTIADIHTTDGSGLGDFTSNLTELDYATTYYVRAYATNSVGTTYGEELSFTTQPILPSVTTAAATDITVTTFTCGGGVTNDGGAEVTARGICWSSEQNPTIADNYTTDGNGTGTFTSNVNDLSCGTTYYVRAYATNSVGTAYGEEYSVTTLPPTIPDVVLSSATIYNGLSIAIQAEVINENCSAITERGVCWGLAPSPTVNDNHINNGNGIGIFSDTIAGLEPATTYYLRAYATNESGTAYSEQESIITPDYPTVTTAPVTDITSTTATSGGNVTSDGGATVTACGVCWSTSQNPTITDNRTTDGMGLGSFISSLTGLIPDTTYYVRAYATNSVGTMYGNEQSYATLPPFVCGTSTLIDIDSNTYNTVQIGNQCWMKENLRTTKYFDHTPIAQGNDTSHTIAYWYYPNNDSSYFSNYGLLYNWKAVIHFDSASSSNPSGVQGICPTGWHVPSEAEWSQLYYYVHKQIQYQCSSSSSIAKALADTTGWISSTTSCSVGNSPSNNNATGFSALPAGYFYLHDWYFGERTYFWSTTNYNNSSIYVSMLSYNSAGMSHGNFGKNAGASVRCICDEGSGWTVELPTVITSSVTIISSSSATSVSEVTDDGGAIITSRGLCWSVSHNPTLTDSHSSNSGELGDFTVNLTGLTANTTYYARAYARNSAGIAYGNEVTFTTPVPDGSPCLNATTLTDIDGNIYNTVQIGNQCWMKENLRTMHYADNMEIPVGDSYSSTDPYRYAPNNDEVNVLEYGYLYNWSAVMHGAFSSSSNPSGVQGICPNGWHVPSSAEWSQLTSYVSNQSSYYCNSSGKNAKALASTTGWNSSNSSCAAGNNPSNNNATGFSAMPAGNYSNQYVFFGDIANFWSTTGYGGAEAYDVYIYKNYDHVTRERYPKYYGFSVRCIRD